MSEHLDLQPLPPFSHFLETTTSEMQKDAIRAFAKKAVLADRALRGDGKGQAEKSLTAHFTPFYLLSNLRGIISDRSSGLRANWVLAAELFAVGGTTAEKICREAGIDPHGYEVRPAALRSLGGKQ